MTNITKSKLSHFYSGLWTSFGTFIISYLILNTLLQQATLLSAGISFIIYLECALNESKISYLQQQIDDLKK